MRFRDWTKTLHPASYGSAKFFVEKDEIETGRRLEVHEFPHRDTPFVEDLGRKANKITVTAYVLGDSADAGEKALRGECDKGGAKTLVLPMERLQAHCESCQRNFARDRMGYVALSLSFWRDGTQQAAPYPSGYHARVASSGAAKARRALKRWAGRRLRTLRRSGIVHAALQQEIEAAAGAIDAVRAAVIVDAELAPDLAAAGQALYDDASELAVIGSAGDRWTGTSFVGVSDIAEAVVVDRIADHLERVREAAEPTSVIQHLVELADYATAMIETGGTPSRRQIEINAATLATVVRVSALTEWALALTEREFRDRRAAIQARADVVERFAAELDVLNGADGYDVHLELVATRDAVVAYLTRLLADLAPVVRVESMARMPSLWWAQRLYADASRASEVVERNGALHASFMPTEFEALAR